MCVHGVAWSCVAWPLVWHACVLTTGHQGVSSALAHMQRQCSVAARGGVLLFLLLLLLRGCACAFVVVLFQNINFDAILKLCTELLTALSTGSSEKYRNIKINFAD